jgi:hypothetical protein
MATALIINAALSIPVFITILGLVLWSLRSQRGDRGHVFVRTRRAPRPAGARPQLAGRRQAWPVH